MAGANQTVFKVNNITESLDQEFFCLDLDSLERSLATIPLHTQIGEEKMIRSVNCHY